MNKEISQKINSYIRQRGDELKSQGVQNRWKVVQQELLENFGVDMGNEQIRMRYVDHYRTVKTEPKVVTVDTMIQDLKEAEIRRDDKSSLRQALSEVDRLRNLLEATENLRARTQSHTIAPQSKNRSESTAVAVWSDWHIEERVDPETVNGMNEFTLEIAKQRTERLFRKTVDFLKMYQQDTEINEMIVALLGDFITNDLHDENPETAQLLPMQAMLFAQEQIVSGINYILEHTGVKLTIPCHSGNHARTTKKVHHATEYGHSLEYMMYHNLANYYKDNERVKFLIPKSYHSFVKIYDYTIRFHHGHDIRYGGGIGGLFIPAYKAISQWDKTRRADLDVFGHFHQTKDGGNFYCNGSLIGFNPYAIAIKADFETPKQNFFLVHKELGRTIMSPIHL